jgi:hypothetical protein
MEYLRRGIRPSSHGGILIRPDAWRVDRAREVGYPRRNIRLSWWSIAIISALSAAVGYEICSYSSGKTGAFVQAFAAGELLTMIAE